MSRSIFAHNRYHLGDCLQSLHLLRALAKQNDQTPFVFFTHACNLPQLREVVADLQNIILAPFETELWRQHEHESIDLWKNRNDEWVNSWSRWNWSEHMITHHMGSAARMGLHFDGSLHPTRLLLDYPALDNPKAGNFEYDFLIGDSAPSSGQYLEWADHSKEPMRPLIQALLDQRKWKILLTSEAKELGKTISEIGRVSQECRHHIMVANAPFFCTLNTTNHHHHEGRKRIALLDGPEQLNMPHILQMGSVAQVMQFAREEKWI